MRSLRKLKQGVWYEIRTRVNNREPLFRRYTALALFARVFHETRNRFDFEIQGLRLEDDWLTFYIKPADGLELPAIMQRLKQTFAQQFVALQRKII
jgi:REP element-mobilizing transposase RayT